MNKTLDLKAPHKNFEQIKKIDENGIEYWRARELMHLLGYYKWSNFEKVVIKKAKISCRNSGQEIQNHFADVGKMIKIAKGSPKEATRKISDYKLSRYACYLIAQNGDPTKKAISQAQTYFAIQTRRQEIFQQLNENEQRLFLRGKVKVHNKELNATAYHAGVKNFGKFNNAGYLGLYSMNKNSVQIKKSIGKDDVLDRAGSTELAANLFRITQTDEKIKREKIKGEGKATFAHIVVGQKVRKSIEDIGGTMPEDLPPEPHIKELEKQKRKQLKASNKNNLPKTVSAGGIVCRKNVKGKIYILVTRPHNHRSTKYILPKGHVKKTESLIQAAKREIEEETGFSNIKYIKKLGVKMRKSYEGDEMKTIHYYLFSTNQDKPNKTSEDEIFWFPINHPPKMFFKEQQEILDKNLDKIKI